ncbi:TPA: N-methyl-L-tryptophan oxidase [Serratia marcescens]|uniref:N-methyl-L-tryptophan oxidase n=2 Tax=Serratia TaxID=613 RepID=UPI0006675A32|nr:N-methyl-L-tryptophan oxidase [Serratia marcescens]EIY4262348.1 N-methyl-L-tryptophan oxidase [Serratia marcescens]MBH3045685.1 N-methyl-L-tryptophan oxidase [Serratia marcescens]MBH3145717.1 N-methyl-L-tryptophan oxidase [Serratia marcescens]HEJ1089723.1 N-methyl-L-tryptophan oxidase [Serratia marcescens]HEJ6956321.1 N-methyl-L-tryptophan oxidase [Serratia marcescens]
MEYDLIVVGSGSVGAAAGYYATRAGLKVLMIDSAIPPHRNGSHHGDTRIIRHAYGEGEKYVPLVLRAQALWNALIQQSGEELFQSCGVLNLGPQHSEFIRNAQQSAQKFRLNAQTLSAEQIAQRWPEFRTPEGYVGVFEPDAGFLRSELAVASLIKLAKEAGCSQLFNCPVSAVEPIDGGVEVVTGEGPFTARKAVVTAGTWVKALLPQLPVAPLRKVFSWHQADGRYSVNNRFPAFTVEAQDGTHYYGFPADNDGLKVGKHDGGQPMDAPEQRKPFGSHASDGTEVFTFLRQFLPGVGVCLHGEACSYDMSPDEDFIIDTLPECDRLMVISGLSGHGFKFASALGEIAALFAQDKAPPVDVSSFGLKRFS